MLNYTFNVRQLVRDSGITGGNESKVGYYVGILVSIAIDTNSP
jgi:hypothetical protein